MSGRILSRVRPSARRSYNSLGETGNRRQVYPNWNPPEDILSGPAFAYLSRYAGAISRPEIDLNAEHLSRHDVVSAAIRIERRAVRGATFVDEDTTSFIAVDSRVTVGSESGSVIGLFQNID